MEMDWTKIFELELDSVEAIKQESETEDSILDLFSQESVTDSNEFVEPELDLFSEPKINDLIASQNLLGSQDLTELVENGILDFSEFEWDRGPIRKIKGKDYGKVEDFSEMTHLDQRFLAELVENL